MKGHVPTPPELADYMTEKLFSGDTPKSGDRILYPGLGSGPFVAAVERFCDDHDCPVPQGIGVEQNPELATESKKQHSDRAVEVLERNFLTETDGLSEFEYVIGNPPYVPIEGLSEDEKDTYKRAFDTAIGRFDLYMLFFEQAIELLADGGKLVFVTPEKYEYVGSGSALRKLLASNHIEEIEHVAEDSFGELLTYPAITTVRSSTPGETTIKLRDGDSHEIKLSNDGESWAPSIRGGIPEMSTGVTLDDVTQRVSCGVATGADSLFVQDEDEVSPQLIDNGWTYPTTSGRQLLSNDGPVSDQVMICPYDEHGNLCPEDELGVYGDWAEINRERLEDRSCVTKGKPWYSMHENPPMEDILQPKILTKDVTEVPEFWADKSGDIVPRHSVYYIIPKTDVDIDQLLEYLNSDTAKTWIEAHAQKAHNDYYRMQSTVLKDLPVPAEFGDHHQVKLPTN